MEIMGRHFVFFKWLLLQLSGIIKILTEYCYNIWNYYNKLLILHHS